MAATQKVQRVSGASSPVHLSTDSGASRVEELAMYGTLRVVSTTALESIDLDAWARRYALAVLAVESSSSRAA